MLPGCGAPARVDDGRTLACRGAAQDRRKCSARSVWGAPRDLTGTTLEPKLRASGCLDYVYGHSYYIGTYASKQDTLITEMSRCNDSDGRFWAASSAEMIV